MGLFESIHPNLGIVLIFVLLASALSWKRVPGERPAILNTLKVFLVAVGLVGLLGNGGTPGPGNWVGLLKGFALFIEGLAVLRLFAISFFRGVLPFVGFQSPRILQDILTAVAMMAWGLYYLEIQGMNLNGIIATSAVLTGVIGFAMQDTLGNVLGGLALQMDASIRPGDWIKIDNIVGKVVETGWRHTAIETRNWETLLIPNSVLMKSHFLVLGRREGAPEFWRRWVWFNVDYRFSPQTVIETVIRELRAASIPGVASDPKLDCVLMDFSESFGRYAIRYWLTNLAADDGTDSLVRTHLFSALKRNGITICIPAHRIFLTKENEEFRSQRTIHELSERVGALSRIDLFRQLTPEELDHLAQHLVPAPFISGDVMTRQGAEAHWLYLIMDGEAEVSVALPGKESTRVATLTPGSIFGEWSLMTGEPRHATVTAKTDVLSYRLEKASFQQILQSRPALAEEISIILAQRQTQLDSVVVAAEAGSRRESRSGFRESILSKIRTFFNLDSSTG